MFVLRLVLQRQVGPVGRAFSTAVIDREKDRTPSDYHTWNDSSLFPGLKALASRSEREESESAIDFLEDEGKEYEAIRGILPVRMTATRPIPWPTIFAHPDREAGPSNAITKTKACDPLAGLVEEGNFISARKVYDELRAGRVFIQARTVYLKAARASLDARDTDGFLFWLSLYPNRPATKNHPGLRSTWEPITNTIITDYPFDLDFITQYAVSCAKKGVLPAIIHDLLRHITFIVPPDVSGPLMDEVLSTYVAHTTSSKSTSERAQTHLRVAEKQVSAWKEVYSQTVTAHGWCVTLEAREAIEAQGGTLSIGPTYIPEDIVKLRDRMAFAVDNPPVAADLVAIIRELRIRWPADEEDSFRDRFIHPPGVAARQLQHSPEVRAYEWWRAIMIVEGQEVPSNHQAVVDIFQDHFRWFGLPTHPARRSFSTPEQDRRLLYPRRSVMTAFLPSLLACMTSFDIIAFHQTYLEQSHNYPPILKPDSHIHNIFIRSIAHHGSTDAALSAIKRIVAHGYECGSQAMTTVLYALARSSNYDDMFTLLGAMERGERFDFGEEATMAAENPSARIIPAPMAVTYDWLANVIRKKRKDHEVAEEVMRRKQIYFGLAEDITAGEALEESTG